MNIHICRKKDNYFSVTVGGMVADHLGTDEALYSVACLMLGIAPPRYFQTGEHWFQWEESYRGATRDALALTDQRVTGSFDLIKQHRTHVVEVDRRDQRAELEAMLWKD